MKDFPFGLAGLLVAVLLLASHIVFILTHERIGGLKCQHQNRPTEPNAQ
jgi:hypothetical protein